MSSLVVQSNQEVSRLELTRGQNIGNGLRNFGNTVANEVPIVTITRIGGIKAANGLIAESIPKILKRQQEVYRFEEYSEDNIGITIADSKQRYIFAINEDLPKIVSSRGKEDMTPQEFAKAAPYALNIIENNMIEYRFEQGKGNMRLERLREYIIQQGYKLGIELEKQKN